MYLTIYCFRESMSALFNFQSLLQSVTFRFRNFSVSKLFHFFGGFGFGIGKFWYRKKDRFRYRKNLVSEKVSDSVSKKFGIGTSFGYGFVQILGILGDVSVSKLLGFETFPFFGWFRIRYRKILVLKKVSVSVSKKFGIEKSIGFGIGKIWYRKKFQIRFRSDFGYRHTL